MSLAFVKYEGAGNDFILIDNREGAWQEYAMENMGSDGSEKSLIAGLCDPKFGIGADGLMLLENKEGFDFEMVYFNSDGGKSSMCGNGGRCIASWAFRLGLGKGDSLHFWAPDGAHIAQRISHHKDAMTAGKNLEWISLSMNDVDSVLQVEPNCYELNTGSPHYVCIQTENIDALDLVTWARGIRYSARYTASGINVNAVNILDNNRIQMRTYERGVEGETLSCGTGVTAAALSLATMKSLGGGLIHVETKGGDLSVAFDRSPQGFCNIQLQGPARWVFSGTL